MDSKTFEFIAATRSWNRKPRTCPSPVHRRSTAFPAQGPAFQPGSQASSPAQIGRQRPRSTDRPPEKNSAGRGCREFTRRIRMGLNLASRSVGRHYSCRSDPGLRRGRLRPWPVSGLAVGHCRNHRFLIRPSPIRLSVWGRPPGRRLKTKRCMHCPFFRKRCTIGRACRRATPTISGRLSMLTPPALRCHLEDVVMIIIVLTDYRYEWIGCDGTSSEDRPAGFVRFQLPEHPTHVS